MLEIARPFVIKPGGRPKDYVVNPESDHFNETIEKRVQFVQGANTFVGIMLLYESIRYIYYYFHYIDTCSAYSHLVIAYLSGNFFWVVTSFYGFGSIDTRNTKKIRQYHNLLIFVLVTRIFVYGMMAFVMDKYQDAFNRHQVYEEYEELIEQNANETMAQLQTNASAIFSGNSTVDGGAAYNSTYIAEEPIIQHDEQQYIEDEDFTQIYNNIICTGVYQKGLMLIQSIIETVFLIGMIFLSKQIRDYVRGYQQFENMKSINLPLMTRL